MIDASLALRHPEAAEEAASDTLSERAAMLIERDIIAGRWQPGVRLGITALSQHYGIGATPLREGLSRLVPRGLIKAVGQRGFSVAHISRADLEDITDLRVLIESEALRRSMRNGGDEWEAGIIAATHRLCRFVERDPATMREGTPEFDTLHRSFHRALIAACGSERILAMHDDLYLQAYRYRRAMMSRLGDFSFVSEHRELADRILARADEAVAMLKGHLRHTVMTVYGEEPAERGADA